MFVKKIVLFLMTSLIALIVAGQAPAAAGVIGIDVSRWQGEIDWETAGNYAGFAIIKAGGSDHTRYTDSQFYRNQAEARRLGIPRGYYYYAGGGNPTEEAEHFASITGPLQTGELVVLDFEIDHPEAVLYVSQFMSRAEQVLGVKPLFYTNMNRVWGMEWSGIANNGNPLWGAIYDDDPGVLPSPGAWPKLSIKQITSRGRIPGIGTDVDINILPGGIEEFYALGLAPPAPVIETATATVPVPVPEPATAVPVIPPDDKPEVSKIGSAAVIKEEPEPVFVPTITADRDIQMEATNIDAGPDEQELGLQIMQVDEARQTSPELHNGPDSLNAVSAYFSFVVKLTRIVGITNSSLG